MADDAEISEAGQLLAELLTSTLMPNSGSWAGARQTYIWEHNALCWLSRNRERVATMNLWLSDLLKDGYPTKPFVDAMGKAREAGAWWNASMEPRRDD